MDMWASNGSLGPFKRIIINHYQTMNRFKIMSIPTAKEFVLNQNDGYLAGDYTPNEVYRIMIGFAKMHVEAALKAASEEVTLIKDLGEDDEGNFICEKLKTYNDEEGYPIYIDEDSILNAYPLNNIK